MRLQSDVLCPYKGTYTSSTQPLLKQEVYASSPLPSYYPNAPAAYCIDTRTVSFAYMSIVVVRCVHKSWVNAMKWTNLKYEQMRDIFVGGNRYDVLENWPAFVASTRTPRFHRTSWMKRSCPRGLRDPADPEGIYLFRKCAPISCSPSSCKVLIKLGMPREEFMQPVDPS